MRLNPFTTETVFRRQILTYKDGPRIEKIKLQLRYLWYFQIKYLCSPLFIQK